MVLRSRVLPLPLVLLALSLAAPGCAEDTAPVADESDFSSNQATLLDFEFDGELVSDYAWNPQQTIQDQLLYTIGHLNADSSVGRLDNVVLTNVVKSQVDATKTKITYHAKLPVAWGRKTNLPTSYALSLPRDVSASGQQSFTDKYKASCVEWGAHDVDTGSMWYYFRPRKAGCTIPDAELVKATATVTKSTQNTTGKYPEYHKVWEDDRLEVVAVFGKFKDGATADDAGIAGYDEFVSTMKKKIASLAEAKTTPAVVADRPGAAVPDVTFEAKLPGGKTLKVVALLVDNVSSAPESFYQRYEQLSPTADLIAYNGHAGLGQNVRALARRGKFSPAKYQIFFMNGCDTFAYVDGSLAQTRAKLNPDDPTGTKYMEFVTNAMPSFFHAMSDGTTTLMDGLLSTAQPKTYDAIFESVDRAEVVLVTGEEDNVFAPGMALGTGGGGGGGGATPFTPFQEAGSVARLTEKAFVYDVPAGSYTVDMTGDNDADLYVRKNAAASASSKQWDCRPYATGSKETCVVTFPEPGKLHVMVRGFGKGASSFTLKGTRAGG
jgi:hypothetical protein